MNQENMKNEKTCHCRPASSRSVGIRDINVLLSAPISRIKTLRDDEGRRFGMTEEALNKNSFRAPLRAGFTLLEILVTVIIIAVLATIAVSAYQKAVVKSRFGSLMPLAKALTSANEEFYLRNGQYATNVSDLDVTSGGTTRAQITMGNESNHKYVLLTRNDMKNQLRMYQKHSENFAGETHCEALIDDELANWLCKDSLKGTLVGNKFGYTVYSLSEETVGSLGRTYFNKNTPILSDGDICKGTVYNANGCWYAKATNGSHCISYARAGCERGTFSNDSTCETKEYSSCNLGSFDKGSSCLADTTASCNMNTYNDGSTCTTASNDSCKNSIFTKQSVCTGKTDFISNKVPGSCFRGTFSDKSYCSGEGKSACYNSTFNDTSYCEAKVKGSCANNTYNDQSYCASNDGFCPVDSPKQGGGTWQLCEGESEGGKTC